MSTKTFTLDNFRKAADEKYGPTEIVISTGETVVLENPLRLKKEDRKIIGSLGDEFDKDDADQVELFSTAILAAAKDKGIAQKLLDEVDEDLAILAGIFEGYAGEVQLGEASDSQS